MKYSNKIALLLAFLGCLFYSPLQAQGWEKLIGDGPSFKIGESIFQLKDGGYIVAGAYSPEAFFAMRLDLEGEIIWQKGLGIPFTGRAEDMIRTSDGHFAMTGYYREDNKDVAVLLKMDLNGDTLWTKSFDSPESQKGVSVLEAQNGDLLISLWTDSTPPFFYSDSDIRLIRTTQDGEEIFTKTFGDPANDEKIYDFIETTDESFLLWGYGTDTLPADAFLVKVDANGDTLWTKKIGTPDKIERGSAIVQRPNGNYTCLYYNNNLGMDLTLLEVDADGNEVSSYDLQTPIEGFLDPHAMTVSADFSKLFIAGEAYEIGFYMISDFEGNVSYIRITDDVGQSWFKGVTATEDGGFAAVGYHENEDNDDFIYLIKTDSLGNTWTNYHQGNVFYDSLENCSLDTFEILLESWVITANGDNGTFYGVTDADGNYEIRTDTGTYTLTLDIPNAYWTACWEDSIVSMPMFFDTMEVDFPVQAEYDCSILNVDISTPLLRRCYPNTYYLSYCNEGTVTAEDPYVEVTFDEWLTVDSSSLVWSSQDGQTFTWELDDVPVGECAGFQVYTTLDCDSTALGQTHCVYAHIYPDSICLPAGTNWDGSTVTVEGECLSDTIEFEIRNIGDDMSQPLNYIVIEDDVLHLNGNFQLLSLDSIEVKVETTGATYRMEAEQAEFHPTNSAPSVTIEGCTTGQSFSLGFVTAYSEDDADPFVSTDCQQNIGSFDPNDKRGFPAGIGEEHIIFHDTELEYHVRFQNTGTDTAFKVVIRDTLSPFLDPVTVRPGASSHPYTWTLSNDGVLKFTFDDIMLPDSNVNELLSHGFVKFKIKQHPGNLPGTVIHNSAAIYFDFNAPVITNMTEHKIDDRPFLSDTLILAFCDTNLYVSDTTFTSMSSNLSWEIMATNHIMVNSPFNILIDTSIISGGTFNGIEYDMDTTLIQQLISEGGCDSTVTINIQLMPSANNNISAAFGKVNLFPNPANRTINISLFLERPMELKFNLRNSLGQRIPIGINKKKYGAGQQLTPININNLPDGIYWLEVKSHQYSQLIKVVVKRK